MQETVPAIIVKDLSFSYPGAPILSHVSFEVKAGECIGVIGPNGGGKSTLLKLLTGILKPSCGSIKLFGHSPRSAYNDIAYVPQTLGFDKQFPISVKDVVLSGRLSHLSWWGTYHKKDVEIAEDSLARVKMSDYMEKPFSTLSGGQLQRVLIARALATKPKLMFLDEPTASVDQKAEEEILSLLNSLKKDITFLLVTHDLNQAVNQVDRLLVVQQDVQSMTVKEVCEHFAMGLYHTPLIEAGHPLVQIKNSPNKENR